MAKKTTVTAPSAATTVIKQPTAKKSETTIGIAAPKFALSFGVWLKENARARGTVTAETITAFRTDKRIKANTPLKSLDETFSGDTNYGVLRGRYISTAKRLAKAA